MDSFQESIVVEGVKVIKIVEPKILGVHQEKNVYLYTGKYGEYLKHDGYSYSIPECFKQKNIPGIFNLCHAIKIIDWKNNRKADTTETRKTKFQNYKHAFEFDILEAEAARQHQ